MRLVEHADLGERYYEEILPGGLRIRVIPRPGFARKYAFLALDYGSMDMAFTLDGRHHMTPGGVAHYLEHKMFDMPYGDAMNRFAELGGSPNAFTSHTMTAYYVECTARLEENLKTLLEFVFTPYFTQKSVDKERGIIGQEIRMYRDSPDSRVYENLFSAMYRYHPVRIPIAGTEESIQSITPEVLTLCHRAFYAPSNAMLCVMGDVDPAQVCRWAEEMTPNVSAARGRGDYGEPEPALPQQSRTEERMEVAMPSFLVGFKSCPAAPGREAMKQEFAGDLTADLLLGASAPLYTDLYDRGLIESSFSAGYEGMKGMSLFSAGGDSRSPETVAEEILREAERVLREGFEPGLFDRVKKAALGRKLRELDSFESTCCRMCSYFFEGGEYLDFYPVLQAMTQEDVLGYIRENLRREAMCLSVIRPKKEA